MAEFVAAAGFEGAREGYVFTTGELGTGYYRDAPPGEVVEVTAGAGSSDDAELQAELRGLGISASTEPIAEEERQGLDELRGVEKPQSLARRAAAAFEAAELLVRGGSHGGGSVGQSSTPPADTSAGARAGCEHLHPDALAKYKECLSLYTDALQHRPAELGDPDLSSTERSEYFSCRAEARIQLQQFAAAIHDCDAAIELSISSAVQAAAEKRKRRAATMAAQLAKGAEDTANITMASAAETIEQNKELTKELEELDPETAKGGLKSMTLMAAVTKLKNRGNDAFKAKHWAAAAQDYRAGILVIRNAQKEARRQREAEREAHFALDGDHYMSEIVESVEVKEAWPGEALNLRNLHGNLAAALIGLVRICAMHLNDTTRLLTHLRPSWASTGRLQGGGRLGVYSARA